MSRSVSRKGLKAEPNLTPMLDMVFQLVTFFMLVINFKANQIDTQMELPVVGTARPVNTKGEVSLLMVNINNKGKYTVFNRVFDDQMMERYIANQAELDRIGGAAQQSQFRRRRRSAGDRGHSRRPRHAVLETKPDFENMPGQPLPQIRLPRVGEEEQGLTPHRRLVPVGSVS